MARDDDDILLGDPVMAATESRDSDGDGVSDLQERLEGTDPDDASDHLQRDPTIAPREDGDPRGDLDRASLERETVFDPIALIPEGMSVDTGLTGLKNLDGSDLPTGPDHWTRSAPTGRPVQETRRDGHEHLPADYALRS